MIYAAALLTGLGGLLIELVLVRRFGLLLGNTAEASALVIGTYLLGLGVGGLLVPQVLRRTERPVLAAAGLYVAVAALALALDVVLRQAPPLALGAGLALVLVTPGIPTVLMGAAFPLVFSALGHGVRPWTVGALMAANLAGSLLGTALGANLWIPEHGLRFTAVGASGVYALAALLLVAPGLRTRVSPATARRSRFSTPRPLLLAAAASGFLVVGLQILLLRRLPFFLEGFQPTLSGVLAAVLLGLTAGSALATPLLGRWMGERAAGAALALGALMLILGLQEHASIPISRMAVRSELAMHGRIWLAALAAAGPPCFFLGAVLPLCVSRFDTPEARAALAGRLFFWQGVGSVLGSLAVGQLLPALWPAHFFVAAVPFLVVVTALVLWRVLGPPLVAGLAGLALAAAALGWSGPGTLAAPDPPLRGPHRETGAVRYLAHRTDSVVTASVLYDRRRHSMALYTNEFRAAETGPYADYMQVLGHLPFLLREKLGRVAVIAFGTGTTAASVTTWSEPTEVHLVEISPAVYALAPQFAGEGPLEAPETPEFLRDSRTRVHLTDGRRFLALHDPAALDLVTMEPLLPYSPGTASLYTREFYAIAAATLSPRGLLVQWIPTHAVPPEHYRSLLSSFARSFPHHSVWFLDGATILVGSLEPHLSAPARFASRLERASPAGRIALHEARITGPSDLLAAYVGDDLLAVVGDAPDVTDDRPFIERVGLWKYDGTHLHFYRPNFEVLETLAARGGSSPLDSPEWKRMRVARIAGYRRMRDATRGSAPLRSARAAAELLAEARQVLPGSVVLHAEETLAHRFVTELELRQKAGRGVHALVRRQLARDAGSALLQAALALPDAGADRLPAETAAARARAIAPLFFSERTPDFLARLAPPEPGRSPLEDVGHLPSGTELAKLGTGDDPLAVALRAAYRVRVGRALVDVLTERPLRAEEQRALAPLLDPALLSAAVAAVRARGGVPAEELAPLRRDDLPLPPPLADAKPVAVR